MKFFWGPRKIKDSQDHASSTEVYSLRALQHA